MADHRELGAGVRYERQVVRAQAIVERRAARRRGIDAHRARQPLHRARAVALRLRERLERIGPIRMDRGRPLEALRMRARGVARIGVGHIESTVLQIGSAMRIVHALESEEQELCARAQFLSERVQALDIPAIGFAACRVEKEGTPYIQRGIEQARHARIEEDAACAITRPEKMDVHVPDSRRVDAFPGGGEELVIGEVRRQRRAARIPQALLGPVAPGGGADGRGARAEKT